MTTPDIAGLCERLRRHANNCTPSQEERGLDLDGMAFAFYGAADALERQAAEIERLRGAVRNIQIEAEREEGRWVHLKRVIAINAHAALTGEG